MLLWQTSTGKIIPIPNSSKAIPLIVSNNKAMVWNNAFNNNADTLPGDGNGSLVIYIYNLDPTTGTISAPVVVSDTTTQRMLGSNVLATAPITSTTQAYHLVTDEGIYRLTLSGDVQAVSTIGASSGSRAYGHGSDGTSVFYAQGENASWVDGARSSTTTGILENLNAVATNILYTSATRVVYEYIAPVDGGDVVLPTPISITRNNTTVEFAIVRHGLVAGDQISVVRLAGFGVSLDINGVYEVTEVLDANRFTVTTVEGAGSNENYFPNAYEVTKLADDAQESYRIVDARRNPFTGFSPVDGADADNDITPGASDYYRFLQISSQTVAGDIRWAYALNTTRNQILVYRLNNLGFQLVYRAALPEGTFLDEWATVKKINPLDGSAIITSDNIDNIIWIRNTGQEAAVNAMLLPASSQAEGMFVSKDQALVWNNAKAPVSNGGVIPNAQIVHYRMPQNTLLSTDLSTSVRGKSVLTTPIFSPEEKYWAFKTLEKTSALNTRVRSYSLTTLNERDADGDYLPDRIEALTGTHPMSGDDDEDGLLDGDEIYPYYVVNGSFTLEEAKLDAAARGGSLAIVSNRDDYTALKYRFSKQGFSELLWLGASDRVFEGAWVWDNGVSLNSSKWAEPGLYDWSDFYTTSSASIPWTPGRPNNAGNADGLVLRPDITFEDRPVAERHGYLIQYSRTDATNADSDSDGIDDGTELENGTNPSVGEPFSGVPTIPDDNGFPDPDYVDFTDKRIATTYEGLVFDPEQGHVFRQKMSVTTKGAFSAIFNGLTSSIKGSIKGNFGLDGKTPVMAVNGLYNARSIQMWMVWNPDEEYCTIYGQIQTYQGTFIGLELRPAQYSKTNPYSLPSALTMGLPLTHAGTEGPRGDGAVTGSISNTGGVKLQMYLPDGGRLSYSGPITVGDLLPVYGISNSRNKSAVIGPVNFASTRSDRDFEGFVRFYSASGGSNSQYPAGFEQSRTVWGSRYYAPPKGYLPVTGIPATAYNTLYNLTGGDFGGITKVGTWAPTNKIAFHTSPTDKSSATFSTKTGLLTYKYTLTDAERLMNKAVATGYAVTIQKSAAISGFYTSSFSNGLFTVTPGDGTIPEITQISPTSKDLRGPGGVYEVEVRTSGAWEIIVPSTATWVQATITSGGVVDPVDPVDPADPAVPATGTAVLKGSGPGTVQITVNSNPTWQQRETKIEIAGIQHKIKQDYRD
jgi:hypothetical protein